MAMKQGTSMALFLGAIFLIVLVGTDKIAIPGLTTTGVGPDGTPIGPTTTVNVVGERACGSTTMTTNFEVAHKFGTDLTAQNATVYINGARKGTFSEGGTFTAQGGDTIRVYNALDIAQTTYLAQYSIGTIPCTGQTAAFLTSLTQYQGEDFMVLGDGQSSLQKVGTVYESDSAASAETIINDDFTSNPGTALSLALGETKTVEVRLHPVFEEGYGVADGNTLACRMTDAEIDQGEVNVQLDGEQLKAGRYIPTARIFTVGQTNQTIKYWDLPAIDGKVTSSLDLFISIKADDNQAPTLNTSFECETFGTDFYEADDGTVKIDIEDRDDNVKIGRTTANEFAWSISFAG